MVPVKIKVEGSTRWNTCDCAIRRKPCPFCLYEFVGPPTVVLPIIPVTQALPSAPDPATEPIFWELLTGARAA